MLRTERLLLLPSHPALAAPVAAFYARNAAHLAPWEPRRSGLGDAEMQAGFLAEQAALQADGSGARWWLTPCDGSHAVLGSVALSAIARGFHHSANLGYALDASAQGRGLMREAVQAVVAHAFDPQGLHLHRLQAACLPVNARSIALLRSLGFREIGLARDYLCIAGRWQDHLLFERLNPDFPPL